MSKVLDNLEKIDSSYIQNFPSSKKIYIQGSRPDIQVPMREIELSPTAKSDGTFEENPPLHVYDTSGVYTDPNVKIDLHQGLKPIRAKWIEERGDTEQLSDFSSVYFHKRHDDAELNALRSPTSKNHAVQKVVKTSPKCTTQKKASLRQKWSMSPFVKTVT